MPKLVGRRTVLRTVGATVTFALAGCLAGSDGTRSAARSDGSPSETGVRGSPGPTSTRPPDALDVGGNWPQRGGGPTRSGATDAAGVPDDAEVGWHVPRIPGGSPVVADGRVYHYARGPVRESERTPTPTPERNGESPQPRGGEHVLLARDAGTGHVEWSAPLDTPWQLRVPYGWPAVGGGLAVCAVPGAVRAYDVTDGTLAWEADVSPSGTDNASIVDGTVVVPTFGVSDGEGGVSAHDVRAYDLADGTERWVVSMPNTDNRHAVGGDTVVVASAQRGQTGVVFGLSLVDGTERWRQEVSTSYVRQPAVSDDGVVYVVGSESEVLAVDVADGRTHWRLDTDRPPEPVAATTETAYVADGRVIRAVSADDGTVRWTARPAESANEAVMAPAVGRDAVYAESVGDDARVVALDPADGSQRWHHRMRADRGSFRERSRVLSDAAQPTVVDGAVYVYAVDGLYAFGPA